MSTPRTAYALLLALLLGLTPAAGCSDNEAPQPKTKAAPAGQAGPAASAQALYADLLVDGSPAPQLTPDLPVVLIASLQNPDPERAVRLTGLAGVRPMLRAEAGAEPPAVTWQALPLPAAELPPMATVQTGWVLTGGLPVGVYWLSLAGAADLGVDAQGRALAVQAAPLRLEVVAGTAPPERLAALQRRILALSGDRAGYLAAVRAALARQPESHPLSFELVQALELNNERAAARTELAALIARTQTQFAKDHPGQSVHLPSWYYEYLRRLGEPAGAGN